MDTRDVTTWFDAYLDLFVALGRGDRDDVEAILDFYGVPMLLSAPGASGWLHEPDQVIGVVRGQVEGLFGWSGGACGNPRRICARTYYGPRAK